MLGRCSSRGSRSHHPAAVIVVGLLLLDLALAPAAAVGGSQVSAAPTTEDLPASTLEHGGTHDPRHHAATTTGATLPAQLAGASAAAHGTAIHAAAAASTAVPPLAGVAPHKQQPHKQLLQTQQQEQQTPAQKAAARWFERHQQQEQARKAGQPVPPPIAPPPPGTPAPPGEFVIPVPAPGTDVPPEVQVALYSPDQLAIRHKLIPGVPLTSQIISILEQMQQAAALGTSLTQEQLETANPLLGPQGRVQVPEKTDPGEFPDGYVAICAIVKNQHRDIREWLEYHRWLGVGKVYVYDNNSTMPLAARIADFMHAGFVEYSFFMGMQRYRDLFRTSSQWWAYNDCVQRFRHRHRWLAFIDADEFIVLRGAQYENRPSWQQQQQQQQGPSAPSSEAATATGGPASTTASSTGSTTASTGSTKPHASAEHNINTFMQQYDMYGGLALNWVIFGSSGFKSRPRGGVLVNYHKCLPDQHEQHTHVKVIGNTQYMLTVGDDPHRVYYNSAKHYTVNELGEQVTQARTATPSHTRIALYHYLTKSEQEYMQKMKRGSAAGNYKPPEFFHTINQFATQTCVDAVALGLKCCPTVLAELGPQGVQQVQQTLVELAKRQQQQQQKGW